MRGVRNESEKASILLNWLWAQLIKFSAFSRLLNSISTLHQMKYLFSEAKKKNEGREKKRYVPR
jgi:hypothetical protein